MSRVYLNLIDFVLARIIDGDTLIEVSEKNE